jgi:hypothetical protein
MEDVDREALGLSPKNKENSFDHCNRDYEA